MTRKCLLLHALSCGAVLTAALMENGRVLTDAGKVAVLCVGAYWMVLLAFDAARGEGDSNL